MQWNGTPNAGFSSAIPWLPVDDRYKTYNVETERKDPQSILNYYHRLLTLRHSNEVLREGKYVALNEEDPNVLAYVRTYKGTSVLVVLNMSPTAQKLKAGSGGEGHFGDSREDVAGFIRRARQDECGRDFAGTVWRMDRSAGIRV